MPWRSVAVLAAGSLTAVGMGQARGTAFVFDPGLSTGTGTDGSGTWDTVTANWFNTASGATNPQLWSNLPTDTAVFGAGGTAGTVNVSAVTTGLLQFNAAAGAYTLNNGTITLAGLGTTVAFQPTTAAVSPTINSVIAGSAGLNTSNGNGTLTSVLTLGGANTYTGPTVITGNVTLSMSSLANGGVVSGIGQSSNASGNLVLFASAGVSNNAAFPEAGATLLYTGGTQATDRGLTLAGAFQDNFNVSSPSAVLTIGGQVLGRTANSFRFIKQGAGTLAFTFAGTNTFTASGNAAVDNGTLILGANGQVNTFGGGLVVGNAVSPAGTAGAPNSPVLDVIGGTVNVASNLGFGTGNVAGNQLLTANVTGGTVNATSVTFAISGSTTAITTGVLNVSGGSVVNVTGATGAFVGAETANNVSVLNLSGSAAVNASGVGVNGTSYVAQTGIGTVNQNGGTFALAGTLNVGGTSTTALGTYNLSGGTLTAQVVGAGQGSSTLNLNGGTLQAANNSTGFLTGLTSATVLAGGVRIDTQAFNVSIGQSLAGTAGDGGLTKVGTGTLTLTGSNAYTGNTVVSLGTVRVNGSTAAGGTVLIPAGGTLGGNGSVGAVTVAGSITAGPDAATVGTLNSGVQTWNASGSYASKLGSATVSDLLVMFGLTIGATPGSPFLIAPTGTGNSAGGSTYVIATVLSAATNPFGPNISSGALILSTATVAPTDGSRFKLDSAPDGGGYDLLLEDVAAPEPTSLVLAAAATVPLALGRRRSRRRSSAGSETRAA